MNDPRLRRAIGYTPDEVREALRPILSLAGKSEKARRKLAPGTWQRAMLRDNVKALRLAVALMDKKAGGVDVFAKEALRNALRTFASMIDKTAKAQSQFPPGTSQHSLQRNRLKALRVARAHIKTGLEKRRAPRETKPARAATKNAPLAGRQSPDRESRR